MIPPRSRLVSTRMCPSWITTRAVLAPTGRCHRQKQNIPSITRPLYKWSKKNPTHPKAASDFGRTVLIDLKTTRQPRPTAWARDTANLDYTAQAD